MSYIKLRFSFILWCQDVAIWKPAAIRVMNKKKKKLWRHYPSDGHEAFIVSTFTHEDARTHIRTQEECVCVCVWGVCMYMCIYMYIYVCWFLIIWEHVYVGGRECTYAGQQKHARTQRWKDISHQPIYHHRLSYQTYLDF